jgi:hypothetical protein
MISSSPLNKTCITRVFHSGWNQGVSCDQYAPIFRQRIFSSHKVLRPLDEKKWCEAMLSSLQEGTSERGILPEQFAQHDDICRLAMERTPKSDGKIEEPSRPIAKKCTNGVQQAGTTASITRTVNPIMKSRYFCTEVLGCEF